MPPSARADHASALENLAFAAGQVQGWSLACKSLDGLAFLAEARRYLNSQHFGSLTSAAFEATVSREAERISRFPCDREALQSWLELGRMQGRDQ